MELAQLFKQYKNRYKGSTVKPPKGLLKPEYLVAGGKMETARKRTPSTLEGANRLAPPGPEPKFPGFRSVGFTYGL